MGISIVYLCRRLPIRLLAAFFSTLFLLSFAQAQTYQPGQAYFGRSNYIEYISGDLPVIFSAPHGGALTPSEIPDRLDDGSDPNFTTTTDSNTAETALALQAVFSSYYGHCPHVIICQLKRSKIDCNRSLAQGVYNANPYATQAWNEFQNYINISSNAAVARSGIGFYIDQHGQGHTIQRLELGYLLSATQLSYSDVTLNQSSYRTQSSIRSLGALVAGKFNLPFSQILRGSNSFGALMVARGYPSVPGPDMPDPGAGNAYFDGGYNTDVHSSHGSAGPVDALQIEANYTGVRDTSANRNAYALAVAQALDYFFTNYYGLDLRLAAPCVWAGGSGKCATATNWANGILPVAGNYILFGGSGGSVNNNLAALTTGSGRIYTLQFAANAGGSYTNFGNGISLVAGITNFSSFPQTVSNSLTLLASQTFSATSSPLSLFGNLINSGFDLKLNASASFYVNSVISGSGGLLKSGGGVLFLNGPSTYSGTTTNLAGLLLANNASGSANGSGALWVNGGALLGGAGTVSGPVFIAGGIAPGNPMGMLTITNGLNFMNGGSYFWSLAANSTDSPGSNYNQIVLSGGNLTLSTNAILVINFTNLASAPAATNAFWRVPHTWKVISMAAPAINSGMVGFKALANDSFPAGKFLSTVDYQGNVLLNYLPTPGPTVSPSLPGAGTGDVVISWASLAGVNYQLLFSTNLAGDNWQLLGKVQATGTNASLNDHAGSLPQRFYRVVIP
ncbi:MAG: hypothetical protein WCS94_04475 [Verrucomicrobiota bacterium]